MKLDLMSLQAKVRARLQELHVPVFMVEAPAGDDFGRQTLQGLCGAMAMVAFCTEEYGASTGATLLQDTHDSHDMLLQPGATDPSHLRLLP